MTPPSISLIRARVFRHPYDSERNAPAAERVAHCGVAFNPCLRNATNNDIPPVRLKSLIHNDFLAKTAFGPAHVSSPVSSHLTVDRACAGLLRNPEPTPRSDLFGHAPPAASC